MPRAKQLAAADLRQQLRACGLRATAPRVAVLETLQRREAPVSHADLAAELAPNGWDRATIYRNLIDLTEAGLVHRADVGDHVWRFELCREEHGHAGGEHPHFMCDRCGDVLCLPGDTVRIQPSSVVTGALPGALARNEFEVQLKGRCDRCA